MKRENKMLVVTAVLSFLSGLVFRHGDSYKVTGVSLMAALAGIVAYNLGLYFGKVETERRRCAVGRGSADAARLLYYCNSGLF